MAESVIRAFFAYPSDPPVGAETVRTAIDRINRQVPNIRVLSWEDARVGGRLVIQTILEYVDSCPLFIADVTGINPNVMFELGYAVGRGKRTWVVLDATRESAKKQYEQLELLTGIGYVSYDNSDDILGNFLSDRPFLDLDNNIFDKTIEPILSADDRPTFLYLKGKHQIEPERRLSNLVSRFQKSGLPLTIDDPNEARIQPLAWYGVKTNSALAVLVHLAGPSREGWLLHNARYAFISGLAYGFEKPILMLAEADYNVPLDYRHLLVKYSTAKECVEKSQPFLDEALKKFLEPQRPSEIRLRPVEPFDLRKLYLGELAAENETDRLDMYFVETAEFNDALRQRFTVFVGRKGSGKTANLFRLAEKLREDARNLVVVVKPLDYDLEGVVRLLRSYRQRDSKGYVIESLWKLLIYSEIASAVAEIIEERPVQTWTPEEQEFMGFASTHFPLFKEDFSVRLERAARDLLDLGEKDGIEETQIAVSEKLHVGFLRDLRLRFGRVLRNRRRVAVLVDNLDKNWNPNGDLQELAELLLGLLSAASRLPIEFGKEHAWRRPINLTLTLFVRNDIFQRVLRVAREPDKISYSRIVWDDPQLLLRVLERRVLGDQNTDMPGDQILDRLFEPMVAGIPTPDYVAEAILPRPRDIIFLARAALATAVNRGHHRIDAADLREGKRQYSAYALDSIGLEGLAAVPDIEAILIEFAGASEVLTRKELEDILASANVEHQRNDLVIDQLLALSFLGIETHDNVFAFSADEADLRRNAVLAKRVGESRGFPPRYRIHKAFHEFLEIAPSEDA